MKFLHVVILILIIVLGCSRQVQKTASSDLAKPVEMPIIPLPWSAHFEDGRLDGWKIVMAQPTSETTWKIEQGMLVQGSRIGGWDGKLNRLWGTHIVAGDARWENYCFQALWRNLDAGGTGLLFRYQDARNHYRFLMSGDKLSAPSSLRLDRVREGKVEILDEISPFQCPGVDSTLLLTVSVNHDSLVTYLNEKAIFSVVDSSFSAGKIGFACFANRGLCIDDVVVSDVKDSHICVRSPEKALEICQNHDCGNYPFGIRGIVYLDQNQNGVLDENEKGIPNVLVSDGREIVRTDRFGVYSLANTTKDAQFVFICTPAHFVKSLNFYHALADRNSQQTFNFPLRASPIPDQLPAQFVQITDIHVQDSSSNQHFQQILASLQQEIRNSQFIVATGDLVENAAISGQLPLFADTIEKFPLPVFSVFGNHDLNNGLNRLANYHRFLGPDYFSFDYANWHFLCLNRIVKSSKQNRWLEQDLKYCHSDKQIIIFQHYPPTKPQLEFLKQFNVRAVFSGHWHSNKIFQYEKILSYNTPPFRFGGIDNSPAGFRQVFIDKDTIFSYYHFSGFQHKVRVVSPVPGETIAEEQLQIILNVSPDTAHIGHITYQLERPNDINEIGQLIPKTKTTWAAFTDQPVFNGEHRLKLTIYSSDVAPEKIDIPFKVNLKPSHLPQPMDSCGMFKGSAERSGVWSQTLHPPLHLKWVGLTRGMIDFAAPVIADSMVFIATSDPHNLNNNFICAFDILTGSLKWCYETQTAIRHSLTAGCGQVMGQDIAGNVYALDLKRGELLWQHALSPNETDMWLYAAPLIRQNTLFAGNAHRLAAIDIPSGTLLWQKNLDGAWISSYSSPASKFDYLLIGAIWHKRSFYALDALDGERHWDFSSRGTHGAPLIHNQTVFWTTIKGKLIAMELTTGRELWQTQLGEGWLTTTPTPFDSLIIVDSGDGKIIAVHQKDGMQVWEFACRQSLIMAAPYKSELIPLTGSPIVTGSNVYFGASDGFFYALDGKTGEKIWEYHLGSPILSTPTVSGNLLFVAALDGGVYCFVAESFDNGLNILN